jgi:hypothetical protein
MTGGDGFFIGWASRPPALLRRWLLGVTALVALGLPLLGLVLGALADDPAGARFATVPGRAALSDLPEPARLTGLLLAGPAPLLHLPADAANARGRTLLLAGEGKSVGPHAAAAAMGAGQLVEAEGYILRRGRIEMLVADRPPRLLAGPAPATPPAEPLGRWRITGEICDGKCAAGGMRPGTGLAHRACATLCLDGELPAVFVSAGLVAGEAFLLLADAEGRAPMPLFRDLIGQRVTLEGSVERRGDLLVFRAERP